MDRKPMTTPRPTVREIIAYLKFRGEIDTYCAYAADALLNCGLPLDAPFYREPARPDTYKARQETPMHRSCPHSDALCPHGVGCTFSCATDAYNGTKVQLAPNVTLAPTPASTAGAGEELAACPFCGSDNVCRMATTQGEFGGCVVCGAHGPTHPKGIDPVAAWNRRA